MQLRTEGLRPYLMGKVLTGTNSCRLLEKVLWQCCADLHKACKWAIKQLAGWQVLKHKLWRREIVFRDSFVSSGSSPSLKAYVFQIHIFNSAYLNSATPLVVSEAVSQTRDHSIWQVDSRKTTPYLQPNEWACKSLVGLTHLSATPS